MPRSSAKSKAKSGNISVNVKNCNVPKKTTSTAKKPKNDTKKDVQKIIKKELEEDTAKEAVTEVVHHRKSERRRVARDIFLVFEEESTPRRRTRGATKKQTKPKFGHLKVEDPIKPKGLLRDIKNEPRCYLNDESVFKVNAALPPAPSTPTLSPDKDNATVLCVSKEGKKTKSEKIKQTAGKNVNSTYSNTKKLNKIKSIKISTVEPPQACSIDDEPILVARVNPIFLWVKQDDTRIVEVRCEDYDKRNRIRITKTSNGWRAIPRSDPTSSRVLKFYPTPLMKVKREKITHEILTKNVSSNSCHVESKISGVCKEDYNIQNIMPENIVNKIDNKIIGVQTVCNPLATEIIKSNTKTKKSKKQKKKKSHSEKSKNKKCKTNATAIENMYSSLETLATTLNSNNNNHFSEEPPEKLLYDNRNVNESTINIEHKSENILCANSENIHLQNINKDVEALKAKSLSVDNVPSEIENTYQKESEEENFSFHLCPKTGLFVSQNHRSISDYEIESFEPANIEFAERADVNSFLYTSKEKATIDIEKINTDTKNQMQEDNPESLDAKTKNLKDLLDDADLLQHCDDNANSDAELIDTLVKTSCENNLIQANEIITKANTDQMQQKTLHDNEMVVQLITDVSDPPKCLSFNEAGEIEGLNGELFQSNTYIETFDKQSPSISNDPQLMLHSTNSVLSIPASPQRLSACENIDQIVEVGEKNGNKLINVLEDSPKDLSYKKREEVCPPSESRSQCAVTSSSDVIKSPQREDQSSLTSSSETLKTLIMEQFLKLNALSTQNQRDPIDLGKQRLQDSINGVYSCKSGQSSDFIETVVIEDDDNGGDSEHDEEPLKKRLRINKHKLVTQNASKIAMIDKDPDPLTQLRLLIRNTQWKVPDPILVPKDRLSAVLASPAREIPLLITTRPELRLPEAFAYPEIIQNPNILVISMAQLEAILKNELEEEKTASAKDKESEINQQLLEEDTDVQINELQSKTSRHHIQSSGISQQLRNMPTDNSKISSDSLAESRKENAKCSQTDSSLSSDLNSATLAMLNQMLWLPYFGQISQDILKSLKNPNLVPFFNSSLNGLTSIDDMYKNTSNQKISGQSAPSTILPSFQQQIDTNDELSLLQKIVQHQMHNVLQLNQLKSDSSQLNTPAAALNAVSSKEKSNPSTEPVPNFVEQRKQKVALTNKQPNQSVYKNQTNNCNISLTEKSYNLRSSVAGRHSSETKQYSNNNQRPNTDNKPRLTCKSLSNLLDPEHNIVPSPSSSTQYVQNLSSDFLKSSNETKKNSTDNQVSNRNSDIKGTALSNATIVPPSARSCSITNISIEQNCELNKQKTKTFVDKTSSECSGTNNDIPAMSTDTNIPLWHPLFGSNTKTAYSSPWQWTTVTATGE